MKKMILMAAVLVASLTAKAWEVGDFYDQDPTGVPAVVAYVDESGEHGLLMAPLQFTEKGLAHYKKFLNLRTERKTYQDVILDLDSPNKFKQMTAKSSVELMKLNVDSLKKVIAEEGDLMGKTYRVTMAWMETQQLPAEEKRKGFKEKLFKQYIADLAGKNTAYGEQNTAAIADYCNENGVDLGLYFPSVNYAISLGEGWFVPGNAELELIASGYTSGVGEDFVIDEQASKVKGMLDKFGGLHAYCLYPEIYHLQSSTMTKSGWSEVEENQKKTGRILTAGSSSNSLLASLVVLTISAADYAPYYALTRKRKNLDDVCILAVNVFDAYPIVVKKF